MKFQVIELFENALCVCVCVCVYIEGCYIINALLLIFAWNITCW